MKWLSTVFAVKSLPRTGGREANTFVLRPPSVSHSAHKPTITSHTHTLKIINFKNKTNLSVGYLVPVIPAP